MVTYPLDISAEQAVQWLLREERTGRTPGPLSCTQSFLVEDIPASPELHLGDVEREDLSEITAVGVLELSPSHAGEGWLFRIRVEDAFSQRLPEAAEAADAPHEIELATFYETFIAPGRGVTFVHVEAEDEAARARFEPLLEAMQTDRHRG